MIGQHRASLACARRGQNAVRGAGATARLNVSGGAVTPRVIAAQLARAESRRCLKPIRRC